MKNYNYVLTSLCLVLSLLSCKKSAIDNYEKELSAFMGTQVLLPLDSMMFMGDSVDGFHRSRYLYVIYTDTTSCSECAVKHFSDWADLELQEYFEKGLLSYVFIVHPPCGVKKRVINQISKDSVFCSSVFVDTTGCFERCNPSLPRRIMMHSFLVNDSSEVVLVGSPINNRRIKRLLKSIIL